VIEKPNTRKERQGEKSRRKLRRDAFAWAVLEADGFRCANLQCRSLARDMTQALQVRQIIPGRKPLEAHHIIKKRPNQPDLDVVENGITLCPTCHNFAEEGYYDIERRRVTGRRFMIWLLGQHKKKAEFRWAEALEELKRKEPI